MPDSWPITQERPRTESLVTGAELRVRREYLGLSGGWLAEHLGVQSRTLRRWEAGMSPIPDGVGEALEELESWTAKVVIATIAAASVAEGVDGEPDRLILTYPNDEEYHAHVPGETRPASWHRAVSARVRQAIPGLRIDFWRTSRAHLRPAPGSTELLASVWVHAGQPYIHEGVEYWPVGSHGVGPADGYVFNYAPRSSM
ncbi:helix-turn-helix domain-containing protein [Sanguibacter sp. 25GB23B1]|uniref:helix-turn-helix domain-containing protein n=1 Tax=unclassified Sanguibacter TaxID=2645534 RepID=UPI0032AEC8E5